MAQPYRIDANVLVMDRPGLDSATTHEPPAFIKVCDLLSYPAPSPDPTAAKHVVSELDGKLPTVRCFLLKQHLSHLHLDKSCTAQASWLVLCAECASLTCTGVGPYTAAAVASIAYEEPCGVVDGNVMRVFARLMSIDGFVTLDAVKKVELSSVLLLCVILDMSCIIAYVAHE